MSDVDARSVLMTARTVVVKVGTNVLSRDDDTLDTDRITALVEQIAGLRDAGKNVVLVSSGAVGAGMGVLGLPSRPKTLPKLQASAAAGQAKLIGLYDRALRAHHTHAAQLLVTANDFKNRDRYLNVRNTLYALLEFGAVPVVNENDTVSIAGICVGDNDRLATLVAGLLDDAVLIVLTVADGLLDGPPSDPNSRRIPVVSTLDEQTFAVADETRSSRGTGGMRSKLEAVARAVASGIPTVIADGRSDHVVTRVVAGDDVGTLFCAATDGMPAWKRWIAHAAAPAGQLHLDAGAVWALQREGRSLLPIGVLKAAGEFERGDVVQLCDAEGREFARGLINSSAEQTALLIGQPMHASDDPSDPSLVHRNNLVMTRLDT